MGNEETKDETESKEGEETGTEGNEGNEDSKQDETETEEGEVKDSHGQPGINKERHEKMMAEKDAEIEKLQAQIAEAAKTEEGKAELQKQIDELKASQADERISHKLEMAGCVNQKAAKALLDDYDGDVSKLKAECPYLFEGEKKSGSTGGKTGGGAPSNSEERLAEARKLAGIRTKE